MSTFCPFSKSSGSLRSLLSSGAPDPSQRNLQDILSTPVQTDVHDGKEADSSRVFDHNRASNAASELSQRWHNQQHESEKGFPERLPTGISAQLAAALAPFLPASSPLGSIPLQPTPPLSMLPTQMEHTQKAPTGLPAIRLAAAAWDSACEEDGEEGPEKPAISAPTQVLQAGLHAEDAQQDANGLDQLQNPTAKILGIATASLKRLLTWRLGSSSESELAEVEPTANSSSKAGSASSPEASSYLGIPINAEATTTTADPTSTLSSGRTTLDLLKHSTEKNPLSTRISLDLNLNGLPSPDPSPKADGHSSRLPSPGNISHRSQNPVPLLRAPSTPTPLMPSVSPLVKPVPSTTGQAFSQPSRLVPTRGTSPKGLKRERQVSVERYKEKRMKRQTTPELDARGPSPQPGLSDKRTPSPPLADQKAGTDNSDDKKPRRRLQDLPADPAKIKNIMAHRASAARSNAKKKAAVEKVALYDSAIQPLRAAIIEALSRSHLQEAVLAHSGANDGFLRAFLDPDMPLERWLQTFGSPPG